ncbi:MAG: phosphoglucosamine mutase [Clostridiales bacterium]|nr:phosphoglucosamine mutase [Clostridiales bacterium]
MSRLFGTDGVRGIVDKELTKDLAYRLGIAGARVLARSSRPKILIGCDTRISCGMLCDALVAGIEEEGGVAVVLGVIPTPAVAVLTRLYEADAAIMISASHNPYEFNGIKFFDRNGYKLSDDVEDKIEQEVLAMKEEFSNRSVRIKRCDGAEGDYLNYIRGVTDVSLDGLNIVLDCANGAASNLAPRLFEGLGANVFVIHNTPNGTNINKECGSTHIESLQEEVLLRNADIGFAFDGDADRVLAVDEKGEVLDGDKILAVIGSYMKSEGKLKNNTIVVTIMSNLGFDVMARQKGINVAKTKVGDRYVLEKMLQDGYEIGGEQSGHVILLKYNTTGDGMLTAIKFLEVLKASKEKCSKLAGIMESYPQVLKNARVKNENKRKCLEDEFIKNMCKELEDEFKMEGRVVIRPSGTEPLIRVMIEGKDEEYINEKAIMLAAEIEKRGGSDTYYV